METRAKSNGVLSHASKASFKNRAWRNGMRSREPQNLWHVAFYAESSAAYQKLDDDNGDAGEDEKHVDAYEGTSAICRCHDGPSLRGDNPTACASAVHPLSFSQIQRKHKLLGTSRMP
eukprot:5223897-Prymnesium_polylepis.1